MANNTEAIKQSYLVGDKSTPLLNVPLGNLLTQSAKKFPDNDAVVSCDQKARLSYAEIDKSVTRVAANLLAAGFVPGERVGIWATNCAEWFITQFATARAGIILVNINPAYRVAELEYVLNKVGCAGLVITRQHKSSDYARMIEDVAPHLFGKSTAVSKAPTLRRVFLIDDGKGCPEGFSSFSDLDREPSSDILAHLAKIENDVAPDDAINIQFTSGTTGAPKGATLTHNNIVNNGLHVGQGQRLSSADRICLTVPLYHCFGMVMGHIASVHHGATVVYPAPSFDPVSTLRAVEEEKCTALYGVPTMFIATLDAFENESFDVSSLRTGIMAGAPCPINVMKKAISDLNMSEVIICYGMTETSPVSFQSTGDTPIEKRVSTVGKILPHLEAKIVDAVGKTAPFAVQGELCVRGYSVMKGYWEQDDATAASIDAEGWMHTGDLAVFSEDGYANITGRAKDVVIRGGENLYPREIEEYLMAHDDIQDVQVFGVPDARFGEVACAWIVKRAGASLTEEEIRAWCKERFAHYKIPAYFKFVDDYPKTVTGKPQRYLMREMVCKELDLKEEKTA